MKKDLEIINLKLVKEYGFNGVYNTYELDENLTSKKLLLVQNEGSREITRNLLYYNLDMVIYIGYRVNSERAI